MSEEERATTTTTTTTSSDQTRAENAAKTKRVVELRAERVSASSFSRFGQLILPAEDGAPYDEETDAQLDLARGRPRFYIMRLRDRATPTGCMSFDNITHHANVTQCLGGLGQDSWFLAVAEAGCEPDETNMVAVEIPPGVFVKLNVGTWHAGPYFTANQMDFANLELVDTNVVDHNVKHFKSEEFVIVNASS